MSLDTPDSDKQYLSGKWESGDRFSVKSPVDLSTLALYQMNSALRRANRFISKCTLNTQQVCQLIDVKNNEQNCSKCKLRGGREREREKERERKIERDRQTDRQIERDRQTDRHTHRQTDRER